MDPTPPPLSQGASAYIPLTTHMPQALFPSLPLPPFVQTRAISSMPHIPFISLSGLAPHIILCSLYKVCDVHVNNNLSAHPKSPHMLHKPRARSQSHLLPLALCLTATLSAASLI